MVANSNVKRKAANAYDFRHKAYLKMVMREGGSK